MTMEDVVKAVARYLEPLAAQYNGKVFPTDGPDEIDTKFGQTPAGGFSILLCWEGWDKWDDEPIPNSGLQWSRFVFIVEANTGLPFKRGSDIPSFSALVEKVITWVRGLQLGDKAGNIAEHGMEFMGSDWVDTSKTHRRHRFTTRIPITLPTLEHNVVIVDA